MTLQGTVPPLQSLTGYCHFSSGQKWAHPVTRPSLLHNKSYVGFRLGMVIIKFRVYTATGSSAGSTYPWVTYGSDDFSEWFLWLTTLATPSSAQPSTNTEPPRDITAMSRSCYTHARIYCSPELLLLRKIFSFCQIYSVSQAGPSSV